MKVNGPAGSSEKNTAEILGIEIHDITMEEMPAIIKEMIGTGRPHHIMTVNPEFMMIAKHDIEFRRVLQEADLKLADGIGIVLAAKILGFSLRERVTGIDLVWKLARVAGNNGYRIFFLGAADGVAERAAMILRNENPGLLVAGTYSGTPNPEDEDAICAVIKDAAPDILLVAYGPPKQDLWIARTKERLQVPLSIGVGGTFDFIAGILPRAPFWVRKLGLEWLFRLLRQPKRWKRQLTLPKFVYEILKSKFKGFFRSERSPGR
jgi:N-acetylglucosaminyldiphosphoundecaprenol N-acetyl-beta-D-mannosaminyltransferase